VANVTEAIKRNVHIIIMLLPIMAFVPALLILYSLHAWTFEQTYHGRTFLLFFLWLAALEIILSWEKLRKNMVIRLRSMRTLLFVIAILLPTGYVVAANYYGINTMIHDLTSHYISSITISPNPYVDWQQKEIIAGQMPISIEYLVFAVLFCLIILVTYGINILTDFSISTTFLGAIGLLFMMDQLYPQKLTPLQIFVPATATLAANVLSLMGYQTTLYFGSSMPHLTAKNASGSFSANIDWACAGVESLLIYTLTILLFLKRTAIPWKHRIVYFAIGAAVTYFINSLRIATLFILGMEYGGSSVEFQRFHNYYGMLYSITWIVCYPLIIIGSLALWGKIRNWKTETKKTINFSTQTRLSE
jgi:exosortase/archaeosortase family protein